MASSSSTTKTERARSGKAKASTRQAASRNARRTTGRSEQAVSRNSDACRWVDSRVDCSGLATGSTVNRLNFDDCRRIARSNPWVATITRLRVSLANYGLRLRVVPGGRTGRSGAGRRRQTVLDEPAPVSSLGVTPTWRQYLTRYIAQVWRERFVTSNAVLFARNGEGDGMTVPPTVLPPESCQYETRLGLESLVFTQPQVTDRAMREMMDKWPDRMRQTRIHIDPSQGEMAVVWRAAEGNSLGFDLPEMRQIFMEASEAEALQVGQHLIAGACRNPALVHLLGYEIKSGPLAGMKTNHAAKASLTAMLNERSATAHKDRLRELARNFDYSNKWIYPTWDLLDVRRFDSVRLRLAEWAGPLGVFLLLSARNQATAPALMRMLQAEMEAERRALKDLIEPFLAAVLGTPVQVHWELRCFQDARVWSELLKTGLSSGPVSHQTFNQEAGRDDEEELDRKRAERSQIKDRLPLFDAAHGDLPAPGAGGSRKPGKPTGRPAGTPDPEPGE